MGILYDSSLSVFIVLVVILGGIASAATGRSVAMTWRPLPILLWFTFLLALAVRFLSFALFEEPLLSIQYLVVDYAVLLAIGLASYRSTRTKQMVTQYSWLYDKVSVFSWKLKPGKQDNY
ncbi:hypothetical protein PsAD2_00578 [Pseudovibrio axinellae]|uniref:DUF6867 domain-containing protein n=1 Tax=Pseudovibrio axinellae TaxID=989403 RepID=A0A166ALU9_9HYPH|nr:hypothetical protein [Pseudovibrio axinellae]KZL21287.1 hypothetical protein PsAD2_00578 [Pseudovibrio axinellae]SEQ94836.1 hypothetical protein SAMN05421798_105201 [Pseudovibrio axinellae]